MDIKKLEQKGALQTIIYLLKVGEAPKTDIGKNVDATFDTLNKKTLPFLEELKLISHIEKETFPYSHIYKLTEKGQELAKCLNAISE